MHSPLLKGSKHEVGGPCQGRTAENCGFALVVTLSLLFLLTVIAVGMLSLSAITLRSSAQDRAQMQARTNARLALQIAIGELQRHAGADTRVTASADILDADGSNPSNLAVTGVWKSWEGSDHEVHPPLPAPPNPAIARPKAPDYTSKRVSEYAGGRFLSWLVSKPSDVNDSDLIDADPAWSVSTALGNFVKNTPFTDSVPLLSTGSVADDPATIDVNEGARQIHVVPLPIESGNQRGTYAWWVSGENQKARLPVPYKPADNDVAGWSMLAKSHSIADPTALQLDPLLAADGATKAGKAITLGTSTLLTDPNAQNPPDPAKQFHDMSASSVGLLTNTATGGWRKDLTLVTENWDTLPASGLPFFRIDASTTTSVSRPTVADALTAPQSILYPWSRYGELPDFPVSNTAWGTAFKAGAVNSWHNLKHYATAYKRLPSITASSFDILDNTNVTNVFTYMHEIQTPMAIARFHWLFSHRTTQVGGAGTPETTDDTYSLHFLITPVVTMWNPYNLTLNSGAPFNIWLPAPMPCAFRHYDRNGNPMPTFRQLTRGASVVSGAYSNSVKYPRMPPDFSAGRLRYGIPTFTLAPGETRVFSPTGPNTPAMSDTVLPLAAGLRLGTGHLVDISSFAGNFDANSPVKVDVVFDAKFATGTTLSTVWTGVWFDRRKTPGDGYLGVNRMGYPYQLAPVYWPPINAGELASPRAEEIKGIWRPILSAVYGPRISGPSSTGLPGKGVLQANPMAQLVTTVSMMGKHPANGANDFSFFKHGANDSFLPNVDPANNRGFIISGFTPAEGISRVVMNEIPRRAPVSLAELQNWDMRSTNGLPPFQLNIIANSDASPLFPRNGVHTTISPLQHDDSYCANHLLFDDWFFSSIAPKSASLAPPTASETLKKTYTDFVSGADPLPNRAYKPLLEDSTAAQTTAGADALFNNHVNQPGSWETIASRLEVEGMFNVNSTSVKAWRALLGHARNQKIPYHTEAGMSLSAETDYAHSRFSVAGDVKAGEPGMSGFLGSSEITGYRLFDDALLDILAKRIVEQVRLRGPFLSLSEFVNRQLTSDSSATDLALAGAIQTALNQMSMDAGANDPYAKLKSPGMSQDTGGLNNPKLAGADYQFPEAAIGKSTYGLPGWTRQADVLRPIAPILSARDDTFTIRAYGDARDPDGKITARATCEATVRRTRDYVDPSDAADINILPTAAANKLFGRRYQIISFRWLNNAEI